MYKVECSVVFRAKNPKFDEIIPAESEFFFPSVKLCRNQNNYEKIDNSERANFPVIMSTIIHVLKNTAKFLRITRNSVNFFRKEIIPSDASPGNKKPFIFRKTHGNKQFSVKLWSTAPQKSWTEFENLGMVVLYHKINKKSIMFQ